MNLPEISPAAPPRDDAAGAGKIYQAGTLRYTVRQIVALFAVLLCGDFCAMAFESIFGPFMPLYLKDFGASSTVIAILTTSSAGLMNLLFLPNLSMWTDRARTRWGRRIPFLLWATPGAVASLVLIAYAPDMAAGLHRTLPSAGIVPLATLTLGVLAVLVMLWHFFNMILVNVYNFLLRDVVPLELMPRFLACFRLVGTAGHFVFQWFLYGHMMAHPKLLFLGLGLVFLASYLAICARVREGDYPPPPSERRGPRRSFVDYFREGLSVPLYRNYFLAYAVVLFGSSPVGPFLTLFARHSLGLSLDQMGKVTAWATLASACLFVPVGRLCERFNPFAVGLASLALGAVVRVGAFFLVHGHASWLVYSIAVTVPNVAWNLAVLSSTMVLFPPEKFGQFSSGLNVVGYGGLVLSSSLVGGFMDLVHDDYRMALLLSFSGHALALIPLILVYRDWKRRGGPGGYVPPSPRTASEVRALPTPCAD